MVCRLNGPPSIIPLRIPKEQTAKRIKKTTSLRGVRIKSSIKKRTSPIKKTPTNAYNSEPNNW
jgi:hypothetical protein